MQTELIEKTIGVASSSNLEPQAVFAFKTQVFGLLANVDVPHTELVNMLMQQQSEKGGIGLGDVLFISGLAAGAYILLKRLIQNSSVQAVQVSEFEEAPETKFPEGTPIYFVIEQDGASDYEEKLVVGLNRNRPVPQELLDQGCELDAVDEFVYVVDEERQLFDSDLYQPGDYENADSEALLRTAEARFLTRNQYVAWRRKRGVQAQRQALENPVVEESPSQVLAFKGKQVAEDFTVNMTMTTASHPLTQESAPVKIVSDGDRFRIEVYDDADYIVERDTQPEIRRLDVAADFSLSSTISHTRLVEERGETDLTLLSKKLKQEGTKILKWIHKNGRNEKIVSLMHGNVHMLYDAEGELTDTCVIVDIDEQDYMVTLHFYSYESGLPVTTMDRTGDDVKAIPKVEIYNLAARDEVPERLLHRPRY